MASLSDVPIDELGRLFLGAIVVMTVAWLSVDWLLRYVAHHGLIGFGVYCILAGLAIFGLIARNLLLPPMESLLSEAAGA